MELSRVAWDWWIILLPDFGASSGIGGILHPASGASSGPCRISRPGPGVKSGTGCFFLGPNLEFR